ncbi:hypothetical protein CRUP_038139, partial [Coryphaenoides rupestris]
MLFTFYHISCDSNSKASTKKRDMVETQVGYAWLPLLKDGRVIMNELVASNLPAGYLSCQDGVNKDQHLHNFFHHCQSSTTATLTPPVSSGGELFVFRTEPFTASTTRTVHEELAKAMTAILKPSTDFLTSNKLLKYSWYFFEALVKSTAQYLIESCKVK